MEVEFIADLLTEDPDVLNSNLVIAVHPSHVIDAIVQAASIYADDSSYRDSRAKMMVNYNVAFQKFLNSRSNSKIIVTRLDYKPYALDNWFDPKNDEVSDPSKIDQEKTIVYDAYQDLEDYLAELRTGDNVWFFNEKSAGDSCNDPHFLSLLKSADLIEVIGGNLTGCLAGTLEKMKTSTNAKIKVIEPLTFDDDHKFWSRVS